jgi:hypothetical protein
MGSGCWALSGSDCWVMTGSDCWAMTGSVAAASMSTSRIVNGLRTVSPFADRESQHMHPPKTASCSWNVRGEKPCRVFVCDYSS